MHTICITVCSLDTVGLSECRLALAHAGDLGYPLKQTLVLVRKRQSMSGKNKKSLSGVINDEAGAAASTRIYLHIYFTISSAFSGLQELLLLLSIGSALVIAMSFSFAYAPQIYTAEDLERSAAQLVENKKRLKNTVKGHFQISLSVASYLRDCHSGKSPWLDSGKFVSAEQWSIVYQSEIGKCSYFQLGFALSQLAASWIKNQGYAESYFSQVNTLLEYYSLYDDYSRNCCELSLEEATPGSPTTIASGAGFWSDSDSETLNGSQRSRKTRSSFPRLFLRRKSSTTSAAISTASASTASIMTSPKKKKPLRWGKSTKTPQEEFSTLITKRFRKNPKTRHIIEQFVDPLSKTSLCFAPDPYQSFITLLEVLVTMFEFFDSFLTDLCGLMSLSELSYLERLIRDVVRNKLPAILINASLRSIDAHIYSSSPRSTEEILNDLLAK